MNHITTNYHYSIPSGWIRVAGKIKLGNAIVLSIIVVIMMMVSVVPHFVSAARKSSSSSSLRSCSGMSHIRQQQQQQQVSIMNVLNYNQISFGTSTTISRTRDSTTKSISTFVGCCRISSNKENHNNNKSQHRLQQRYVQTKTTQSHNRIIAASYCISSSSKRRISGGGGRGTKFGYQKKNVDDPMVPTIHMVSNNMPAFVRPSFISSLSLSSTTTSLRSTARSSSTSSSSSSSTAATPQTSSQSNEATETENHQEQYEQQNVVGNNDDDSDDSNDENNDVKKPNSDRAKEKDSKVDGEVVYIPPWNHPKLEIKKEKRFRQHVNPLASQYQLQTILHPNWPLNTYEDCTKQLHLDIGCGKGGFLLDLCKYEYVTPENQQPDMNSPTSDIIDEQQQQSPSTNIPNHNHNHQYHRSNTYNYLGLEIRPPVAQYAQTRIKRNGVKGLVDFIGCNVNVDLERILQLYQQHKVTNSTSSVLTSTSTTSSDDDSEVVFMRNEVVLKLHRVTIQFPDPHFKTKHNKRRVVTNEVITTLAKYMPLDAIVFLQSDVKPVLDDMRGKFRDHPGLYFIDQNQDVNEYLGDNIFEVRTEREGSVMKQNLPVYRALFTRTSEPIRNLDLDDVATTTNLPTETISTNDA